MWSIWGTSLLLIILLNAFKKESTSDPYAISRCTALDDKHVNNYKYLFCLDFPLPCMVANGPPKSTAALVNALNEMVILCNGSVAMIW